MNTAQTLEDLRTRILAGFSLLLLETYEERRWEEELANLAGELNRGLVTWTVTGGASPPVASAEKNSGATSGAEATLAFLRRLPEYPEEHLFLMKDVHPYLDDPRVVRQVRDLLPSLVERRQTLVWMGPVDSIPVELMKEATALRLPLPDPHDLRVVVRDLVAGDSDEIVVQPDDRQEEHLAQAVMGLTIAEAQKALRRVLRGRETLDEDAYAALVAEKRHMVEGSDLLEFFDLDEGIRDIGGLEGLKEWIQQRSEAFSLDAQERGIQTPRGVLLTGVQGCGKSLSAKAIAKLLGFPLVRMDLSRLLEGQFGASEQNLRNILRVMETIAPSVLWLEEIDKAFAGFSDDAVAEAAISRIVGHFLTWLQEHTAPVFVVATANNVDRLPPELLRRGRFDELFFVDLPNFHERRSIFEVHLSKRNWKPEKFDIEALATQTEGYSGAEIEQAVNSAIIESFSRSRVMQQSDLAEAVDTMVPLSVTMEDQIFSLREWARTRCRPATVDARVMQVLEEEERRGEVPVEEEPEQPKWMQLAEAGQLNAAVIELVRLRSQVTVPQLQVDLRSYLDVDGEFGLVLRGHPKVVICTRISREFADLLTTLLSGRRVFLHPAEASLFEPGGRPNLPVIESVPSEAVDRPQWLPTLMRAVPPATGSAELSRLARIRLGKASG